MALGCHSQPILGFGRIPVAEVGILQSINHLPTRSPGFGGVLRALQREHLFLQLLLISREFGFLSNNP